MGLLDIMSRYEGQAEEVKKNQEEKKEQEGQKGKENQTGQTAQGWQDRQKAPMPASSAKEYEEKAENQKEEKGQEKEEPVENIDPYYDLKNTLQKQAVQVLNEKYTPGQKISREEFVKNTVTSLLDQADVTVPRSEREKIIQAVMSEIIGLGPLDALLADDGISEIMVNGPEKIFVEKHGKLHLTNVKFRDNEHVMTIVNRIVSPLGRHIDEASPLVDARLADGSRVNVIIPPLALDGPTITIRKFPKSAITAQNLIHWGSASPRMMEFLEACVLGRQDLVVTGGTGSGKALLYTEKIYSKNTEGELVTKSLSEIKIGDIAITRDGKGAKITGIYPQGKRNVWVVELRDGRKVECCEDHLWTVAKESHGTTVECTMSTKEMYEKGVIRVKNSVTSGLHHQSKYWLPRVMPIESEEVQQPIDPWFLGYLIGNGSMTMNKRICFCTTDKYILDRIKRTIPNSIYDSGNNLHYLIRQCEELNDWIVFLKLNVPSHKKHILKQYKCGSLKQRTEILRGLMDSDGSCGKNGTASYSTVSKQLAEDVQDVARTLGFSSTISLDVREDKYWNSNNTAYTVFLTGGHINPFSLPRKAEVWEKNHTRKNSARHPQTFTDCPEDGMSYLAGYLFQAKMTYGVPYIADRHLDGELMERLIRYLPEGAMFRTTVTTDGVKTWSIKCPSVKSPRMSNGIGVITREFGYAAQKIMERNLPDDKYCNAEFVRGLADFCGNVHGGDVNFACSEHCRKEIAKVLDKIGLTYTTQKQELQIHNFPSTLAHKSDKVQLLRQWEEGMAGSFNLRNDYVPIVNIYKTDRQEEMVCIKVEDDSHTFVLDNGVVTHNTTLLNVLSNYIPADERIVTIEDSAELQLQQDHVVRLEARPANAEGKGRIAIRDLVINALRMRPDRIVVGECRGGEALDMLTAMNTGHDGSLTTAHANSPRDALSRLETMVMMAGMELPEKAIRQQISSAINIIVQQARLRDGSRKIISISEITGMEGSEITMQEIYRFRQTGLDEKGKIVGVFEATGVRPNCIEKLQRSGALVRDDWFVKGTQN